MDVLKLQHIPPESWVSPAKWCLLENFHKAGVTVPKGFVTDGASVPFIFWWLCNPTGKALHASIVHDYLLSKVKEGDTRRFADEKFAEVLEESGVSSPRKTIMFFLVRAYGIIKNLWFNVTKRGK